MIFYAGSVDIPEIIISYVESLWPGTSQDQAKIEADS